MKRSLLCLFLVCTPASATTYVYGAGTQTCAKWSHAATHGDGSDRLLHTAWLSGFVSAFNMFGQGDGDALKLGNLASAERWVDSFCRKNPRETVSTAMLRLVEKVAPARH